MSISKLDLERAYSRIRGIVNRTPTLTDTFLDDLWDCKVIIKCEQFQPIGAFKMRGASNFALRLNEDERSKGFVTHSSGNHAQAVAYMAQKLKTTAYIVMPENANKKKIENARRWGAQITLCKPTFESRIEKGLELQQKTGGTIIPPFDHEWIVEGQASCGMEIIADHEVDMIAAPLGGGGLLAGTALAAKYFGNNVDVIGAEPDQAADGYEGFKSGKRVTDYTPNTVADGLRTSVGEVPFSIIKDEVKDIILAKESNIVPWMYRMWSETKVLMETSSAVAFAAIDDNKELVRGKRIAIIVTGGNIDLNQLP